MDSSEKTEIERTRRIRRSAVISIITLVILVLIAVGIYVIAFVILSPMIG
jgi:flagellar basal body-associated protein FliL